MLQTEEKLAVVDFGGQYTHLIARRIREFGIYSQIYQPEDKGFLSDNKVKGIILSGSPDSADLQNQKIKFEISQVSKPMLGICFGHQLIASCVGGKISKGGKREYGSTLAYLDTSSLLFKGMDKKQQAWMSHSDYVRELPPCFKTIASTKNIKIASFENADKKLFGVQFHPEVTHTENGKQILKNFIEICNFNEEWNLSDLKNELISKIKKKAKDKKLFLLVSGGVDSLVVLALCLQAAPADKIYPLHIDTGFMRKNESDEIISYLEKNGFKNLKLIKKEKKFLQSLQNVVDPEIKRAKIGKLFVEVLNEEISHLDTNKWMLVQGTIYPDTIESGGTEKSSKIKTHHNRVKEIDKLIEQGKVIEPLQELYKDEVRQLGSELDLPQELINRQPFPGPGLAIRVICSNGKIEADYKAEKNKFSQIVSKYKLSGRILPVRSVGVQGDFRTYHHPALIWNKEGDKIDWENIRSAAHGGINNLTEVNRVVYSIEPVMKKLNLGELYLTKDNLDLLREVDRVVRKNLQNIKEIWQAPVIMLPLYNKSQGHVFVIRPVCSSDGMTADFYEMEPWLLRKIIKDVRDQINESALIFYDVTTKPPGTIECE